MDSKSRRRACELGYLHRADGSCLYSLGETVIVASVNGPGDLRATKQVFDRALVDVAFHTKVGGSTAVTSEDAHEKQRIERHLKSLSDTYVLTKQFPRTTIVVTVQEMQNQGCLLASSINATCLALLDAGLPMKTVFAAVTCILSTTDDGRDSLLVEPALKQEKNCKGRMTFVFESNELIQSAGSATVKPTLGFCSMEGVIAHDQLKAAQELCRAASEDVFRLYRTVVEKRFGPGTDTAAVIDNGDDL